MLNVFLWCSASTSLGILAQQSTAACILFNWEINLLSRSFPNGSAGKESACSARNKGCGFNPWVGNIQERRKIATHFVKFRVQRSLVGYSPKGHRVGGDWATKHLESLVAKLRDIWVIMYVGHHGSVTSSDRTAHSSKVPYIRAVENNLPHK